MDREDIDGDEIFVNRGLLAADECTALVRRSQGLGYEAAPVADVLAPEIRNNARVVFDDSALAADLFARARPFLPARADGLLLAEMNERLRFHRYAPGQQFRPHQDAIFERIEVWEESRYTFLVYLADAPDRGETRFFAGMDSVLQGEPYAAVRPEAGAALAFHDEIIHEGAPVRAGTKYVLRTDVMYRPDRPERAT